MGKGNHATWKGNNLDRWNVQYKFWHSSSKFNQWALWSRTLKWNEGFNNFSYLNFIGEPFISIVFWNSSNSFIRKLSISEHEHFICRDQHVQETLIVAPVNVWITQMYFVILEVSFWINEIPCRPKRLSLATY